MTKGMWYLTIVFLIVLGSYLQSLYTNTWGLFLIWTPVFIACKYALNQIEKINIQREEKEREKEFEE